MTRITASALLVCLVGCIETSRAGDAPAFSLKDTQPALLMLKKHQAAIIQAAENGNHLAISRLVKGINESLQAQIGKDLEWKMPFDGTDNTGMHLLIREKAGNRQVMVTVHPAWDKNQQGAWQHAENQGFEYRMAFPVTPSDEAWVADLKRGDMVKARGKIMRIAVATTMTLHVWLMNHQISRDKSGVP